MANLIERVRVVLGAARQTAQARYRQLLEAGDGADEREVLAIAEQLDERPEDIERDVAVVLEAKRQQALAARVEKAVLELRGIRLKLSEHDAAYKQTLKGLENWHGAESAAMQNACDVASAHYHEAERAAGVLADLRIRYPDLLG